MGLSDIILLGLLMTAAGLGLFALLIRGQAFVGPPAIPQLAASHGATEMAQARMPFSASPDDEEDRRRPDEKGVPRWLRSSVREARGAPTELRQRDWR